MKRLPPQTLAASAVLALLAMVAVLTWRPDRPLEDSFASTDYGPSGYRAWAALLARERVGTSRFVLRPIELDDRTDTLISAQPLPDVTLPNPRTEADLAALAAWVGAGGRLVYLGRNAALSRAESRLLELPVILPDVGERGPLSGPLAAQTGALRELGTDRLLVVQRAGRTELADGNGGIVVRYPLGRGEVVAVVDAMPFANANIGAAGNARLAYALGVPRAPGGGVAFDDGIHGALIDRPWYRALPVPLRVSLALLGGTGLLALAGGALRSGAPVRLREEREPTSMEFVEALAALHERIGARKAAGTLLVRDALAAVARANGRDDRMPPVELAAAVAAGPQGADIRRLVDLLDAPIVTDAALLASAQLAHNVRKDCTYDGHGDGRRTAFAGRTRARRRR